MPLIWTESESEDWQSNTWYEADSRWHDEGQYLVYRIRPEVWANKFVWSLNDTDGELRPGSDRLFHPTLEAAKAMCEELEKIEPDAD